MTIRANFVRVTKHVFVAAVLAALGAGVGAASASAMTRETGCPNLQTTIDEVAGGAQHGEGDVIVLDGLCDQSNLPSPAGVTLPAGSSFSIEGKPGTTSGFDGAGITGPLLGNTTSTEAGAMTISHLTFQHASLTDASALSIRASRVTLTDDSFLDDEEHGVTGTRHSSSRRERRRMPACFESTGGHAHRLDLLRQQARRAER